MPKTLTRALYRIGLHHDDGSSSLVSLDARPVRMVVGELAASAADAVNRAKGRPSDDEPAKGAETNEIGPSTP